MKAGLTQKEPKRLEKWESMNLQEKIREKSKGKPKYILHDGPPYANGHIHMGHALNKVLKDLLVRYKTMSGFDVPYIPGWDCHGLPIEQAVLKKIGRSKMAEYTPIQIRKRCAEEAHKWINIQRDEFKRLFVGGEWDDPYLTLNPRYEVGILKAFRRLVERGVVYHSLRPVYWDSEYQTALAEAEIEYETTQDPSIYVAMPLLDAAKVEGLNLPENAALVIWTTTPWTMPANLGVSLHPDFDYCVVNHPATGANYIVAQGLAEQFIEVCGLEGATVGEAFKPAAFDKALCQHPILNKTSLVMLGDHVTLEQGTGCVHTAPGHGKEDFDIGNRYGLPAVCPVGDDGKFIANYFEGDEVTDAWKSLEGQHVHRANDAVLELLRKKGVLLHSHTISHEYPHSWRSHKPIIFRATEQWFMDVDADNIREDCMRIIDEVEWIPKWGRERIVGMMTTRPAWCLSRQRSWGVPIPALKSLKTGKVFLDLAFIDSVIEVVGEKGTDAWFTEDLSALAPEGYTGPDGESLDELEKQWDVLDVWFDSGASHISVCEQRTELQWPADLYLEGSDQHRGWFQTSLLVGVGARDNAPFRSVLTHGFTLDAKGEAMSKSKGNTIAPEEIMKKYGADILRLWVASEDYRVDMKVTYDRFDQLSQTYMRMRNTLRFLLGNLHDFDAGKDAVAVADMPELDQFALHKLAETIDRTLKAYDQYEFHRVVQILSTYCSIDLGAFYLDLLKDRLYCEAQDSTARRASQTVLHHIANAIVRLLAPILPHTADEVWENLPGEQLLESVHLADMPERRPEWQNDDLAAKWQKLQDVRAHVLKPVELARKKRNEPETEEKFIGNSLEGAVTVHASNDNMQQLLKENADDLAELFIVSQVKVTDAAPEGARAYQPEEMPGLTVLVSKAKGEKCERCWRVLPDVGLYPNWPTLCGRCATVVSKS
jgi:isoleucyl-tRNA synthetase